MAIGNMHEATFGQVVGQGCLHQSPALNGLTTIDILCRF